MTLTVAPSSSATTLDRALVRGVAFAVLSATVLVCATAPLAGTPRSWAIPAGLGLGAVAGGRVLLAGLTGSSGLASLSWLAVGASATNLLLFAGGVPGAATGAAWIVYLTVLGVCAAPLAVQPPGGAVLAFIVALTYLPVRVRAVAWPVALLETLILALAGLIVALVARDLRRAHEVSVETQTTVTHLAERAAADRLRDLQRQWWDLLIHDKVLAALLMGARATTLGTLTTARRLAQDALDALGDRVSVGSDLRPETFARTVRQYGTSLGLSVETTVDAADCPLPVLRALWGAVQEALLNVAKHAGTARAAVTVRANSTGMSAVVSDFGCGFDPAEVPAERFGLRRSLPGHLATVGGTALVRSAPGIGTSVQLEWTPAGSARRPDPKSVGVHLPSRWLLSAWFTLHVALAAVLTGSALVWPVLPAIALLAAAVAVMALDKADGRAWLTVALALAGLGWWAAVTPAGDAQAGRFWVVSAVAPLCLFIVVSGHLWPAVTLSMGGFGLLVTRYAAAGPDAGRSAAVAGSELALLLGLGLALSWVVARADAHVRQSQSARLAQAADREAAAAQEMERGRRMELLTQDAVPLLRRLVDGKVVTGADRARLRLVEAALRDHLLAEPLLTAQIEGAVATARSRGARVVLSGSLETRPAAGPGGPPEAPELAAFRTALVEVLAVAGDGSSVHARWSPNGAGRVATIAAEALTGPPTGLDRQGLTWPCTVEIEDGSVWFETTSSGQTTGSHGTEVAASRRWPGDRV